MNDQLESVLYEVRDGVAVIQLNRPESKNAFNRQMRMDLANAIVQADSDGDVRVIVLTGSSGAFSSGQDLVEGVDGGAPTLSLVKDEYGPIIHGIDQSNKLVIAAIDGPCAGIGASITLACDFVVMSVKAYYYLAFIAIGLLPDGGATWQLVNQVGYKRALEIVIGGEKLMAGEAVRMGLANRLSKSESALDDALVWAQKIANQAPLALGYSKRALKMSQGSTFGEAYAYEGALQAILTASDDAQEGIKAFVERRHPVFKGL